MGTLTSNTQAINTLPPWASTGVPALTWSMEDDMHITHISGTICPELTANQVHQKELETNWQCNPNGTLTATRILIIA